MTVRASVQRDASTKVWEFYGITSGALSGATVTVTCGSGSSCDIFGITGISNIDPSNPFAIATPVTANGTGSAPATSPVIKLSSDLLVLGLEADQTSGTSAGTGSGFSFMFSSTIGSGSSITASLVGEYELAPSGCSSGCTVDYTGTLNNWVVITDLINPSPSSVPVFPMGILPLVLAIPVLYFLISRRRSSATGNGDPALLPEG
jgi:hypothetical protein